MVEEDGTTIIYRRSEGDRNRWVFLLTDTLHLNYAPRYPLLKSYFQKEEEKIIPCTNRGENKETIFMKEKGYLQLMEEVD